MRAVSAACLPTVHSEECGRVCKVPMAGRVRTGLWGGEVWLLWERREGGDLTPETCLLPWASATAG